MLPRFPGLFLRLALAGGGILGMSAVLPAATPPCSTLPIFAGTKTTTCSTASGVAQRRVAVLLVKFGNTAAPVHPEYPTVALFKQHLRTVFFGADPRCPPALPPPVLLFDRYAPALPFTNWLQRGYPITPDHPSVDGQWYEASYGRVHAAGDVYEVDLPANKTCGFSFSDAQAAIAKAAADYPADFQRWIFDQFVIITKARLDCPSFGGASYPFEWIKISAGPAGDCYYPRTGIAWNETHAFGSRVAEPLPIPDPNEYPARFSTPERVAAVNQGTHESGHMLTHPVTGAWLNSDHEGFALETDGETVPNVNRDGSWVCGNSEAAANEVNISCLGERTDSAPGAPCQVRIACYGDPMTPTGGGMLSHHSAPDKTRIGWLTPDDSLIDIEPGSREGLWNLLPYTAAEPGVKALRIRRFGGMLSHYFWLEYRRLPKSTDAAGNYDQYSPHFRFPPHQANGALYPGAEALADTYPVNVDGAWIRYSRDLESRPYLLDFTPGSRAWDTRYDARLRAASTWRDPYGDAEIRVSDLIAPGRLSVHVSYPCYPTLTLNGQPLTEFVGHPPQAAEVAIDVSTPAAGCQWADRLTVFPGDPGMFVEPPRAEAGKIRYKLPENTTADRRHTTIRLRSRFLLIVQNAAAAPRSGSSLVGDRDLFHPGDADDNPYLGDLVDSLGIGAPGTPGSIAVKLDEPSVDRAVSVSHFYRLPDGALITGGKVRLRLRADAVESHNDLVLYDETYARPGAVAGPPYLALRDLLGRAPVKGEVLNLEINLARVPVRTAAVPPGDGVLSGPAGAARNLLGTLRNWDFSLIFLDDTAVDYSLLEFSYVTAASPRGELDGDGDIDLDDLALIQAGLNTQATQPEDPRDLKKDGRIDVLDARTLVTLCSRPGCAVR